jgi:mono/diheme cytochrome c family protein
VNALNTQRSFCIFFAIAVTALLAVVGRAPANADSTAAKPATVTIVGRSLYREYCGKCHALAAALAAGFGSKNNPLGGPSFNDLRVPYKYSIQAVTEPTGGHEALSRKMSAKQISVVATYIAKTTAHHPLPALPTDG